MSSNVAALSYHEPGIVTILILASFLLLQNVVNWAFDRLLFCGLIGQIAIGVAWGKPGADWLSDDAQNVIMQIGYLGLVLLVFEGGLSTDLKTLKSNLLLSSLVALTGISAPIGLSFLLPSFVNGVTSVQAFAAGAALCSTSLGTTFTILSTSGLSSSRLGVVLSSAAMMDDIVGLVMSGIISSLGTSSDFSAVTVIRPVFVSIAFAIIVPLVCAWMLKPLTRLLYNAIRSQKSERAHNWIATENAALVLHALVLSGLVAAASYAGTSNLFAAYLAGAVITWWDGLCKELRGPNTNRETDLPATRTQSCAQPTQDDGQLSSASKSAAPAGERQDRGQAAQESKSHTNIDDSNGPPVALSSPSCPDLYDSLTGMAIFDKYYSGALQTILKPFFFASIGFAIPISQMFTSSILWRGFVYTILMLFAKLICGLFLVRFATPLIPIQALSKRFRKSMSSCWPWPFRTGKAAITPSPTSQIAHVAPAQRQERSLSQERQQNSSRKRPHVPKPISLYPAALLGSAMVARGEIGFLISSVAESDGVFGSDGEEGSSELFLVVTWAILLCTLLGPIAVGLMVKRVKRLQERERSKQTGKDDPLGIWGVIPDARQPT
ncbi:High-affinity Na(+)/H(+) antiporter NhaS3 [Pseudocercospora fuligena]|uniref:High-affinity Na(+)/H(+) antiporter NhaS3 n=1 Tax=Pseudocercospora fuligena TaxID=685502 RepID=A0A8H6RAI9_9PEZI|nr:High-affinity Na(+)/H(+) antiporter NhaS3 [Pseudocercospora fuligena]